MEEFLDALKKYAVFEGRASRREYWMFVLGLFLTALVLGIIEAMVFHTKFLGILFGLATAVPSLAIGVRRLHDTNRSGWWYLVGFIPLIGFFVLLFFLVQESRHEGNQYGDVTERTRIAEQTLADFIAQSRAAGQTDEQIKITLLEKGWAYKDIESVLNGETAA